MNKWEEVRGDSTHAMIACDMACLVDVGDKVQIVKMLTRGVSPHGHNGVRHCQQEAGTSDPDTLRAQFSSAGDGGADWKRLETRYLPPTVRGVAQMPRLCISVPSEIISTPGMWISYHQNAVMLEFENLQTHNQGVESSSPHSIVSDAVVSTVVQASSSESRG